MLIRLALLWHGLVAALAVAWARIRRGRAYPDWGFLDELVAAGMKRQFARIAPLPWPDQRRNWSALAIPGFAVPGVRFERKCLGAREAQWVTPKRAVSEPPLTLFYLHGGAYLFGSTDEYREFVARGARAASVRAVMPEYRLAPEHPFPAALEDALAAYQALLASGADPARVVLAGDSAGGGLSASLMVTLRERGLPLPARAVLMCPWVDLRGGGASWVTNSATDVFTPDLVAGWARTVLAGADPSDPRASPVNADLRGLPPLLVLVGGAEMLHDQVLAFVEKARAAGVSVDLLEGPGCIHDWPMYSAVLSSGRRAVERIAVFVRG